MYFMVMVTFFSYFEIGYAYQQHPILLKTNIEKQWDCLSRNAYFEARNQPTKGIVAIVYVTLNRAVSEHRRACSEVYEKGQFGWVGMHYRIHDNASWIRIKGIVWNVIHNYKPKYDPTHGATYYCGIHEHPHWRYRFRRTVKIKDHVFFRSV